jgi:hypothetical protein
MIADDIMEGVVSLLQGIWPDLDENGIDHGGAVTILPLTEPTRLSMGSRAHGWQWRSTHLQCRTE